MEENREAKKITFDDLQYIAELVLEYQSDKRALALEELNRVLVQGEREIRYGRLKEHVSKNAEALAVSTSMSKVIENYNKRDVWEDYYDLESAGFTSATERDYLSSILKEILQERKDEYRRAFDDLVDTIGRDTAVFLPVCFKQMKDTLKDIETYLTWI